MRLKANIAALVALFLVLAMGRTALATAVVGMQSPDDAQRGASFKVQILAPVPEGVVEDLQLYLRYDSAAFTFVKANSILIETLGADIPAGDETKERTLNDNGQFLTMLAFLKQGSFSGSIVAELEFQAKIDAPIGPAQFTFFDNSFITISGYGRVPATTAQLEMKIVDGSIGESAAEQPIAPAETPAPTPAPTDPNAPPFDSANLAPSQGSLPSDQGMYGVDRELGASPATTPAPTDPTPPTPPPTPAPTPTPTQGDLLTVNGERLDVPANGLPVDQIPSGFRGDTVAVKGHQIPAARSSERNVTLYYLAKAGLPGFYSYDFSTDRFSDFDLAQLNPVETSLEQRAFTRGEGGPNLWIIVALSLVCLSAFCVLLYSVVKEVKGRRPR